jgi:hypothetical protein
MADLTTITKYEFFYDAQVRRYLLQIVRAFSGFQYMPGNGIPRLVPCRVASQNRQVGHIMRNNSENTLMTCPMITVFIKGMAPNRERTQDPYFVSKVAVNERAVDPTTGKYTNQIGRQYTVERSMPHPVDATIQVDIWTSNEMQKHQLFEQIYPLFNPSFDIQSSDNPLDWTSLTTMFFEELTWSSRAIPVGTGDEIDVMSFTFRLPLWINPPALVKEQHLIQQVITNIHSTADVEPFLNADPDHGSSLPDAVGYESADLLANAGDPSTPVVTTPGDHQIAVQTINDNGDVYVQITLLGGHGDDVDEKGNVYNWETLLQKYGSYNPTSSTLRLAHTLEDDDTSLDTIGTFSLVPGSPNLLIWNIIPDTLPGNTLANVTGIIDPLKVGPGVNGMPPAAIGQRYLLLSDFTTNNTAWGGNPNNFITASANDIIQYGPLGWTVAFDASAATTVQFVLNEFSLKQLKFDPTEHGWMMAIDGHYYPGYWRLKL